MPLHGKIVVIKRSGGDGTEFPLTATCLFGRKPDCDIRIQLPQVSKEHCRIDLNENKEVILTNLSAVNPICVNGEVLKQSERLKHGDVITIIDRSFRFEYPPLPTPKKRSSRGGKNDTLKVLQDQQTRDSAFVETAGRRSAGPHLKDGTNMGNIQRSLEKTLELESKEEVSQGQTHTSSPFNDLYQMIKKSLDVKTPRKPSMSLLQTPSSSLSCTKPTPLIKKEAKSVITEDGSTPRKDGGEVFVPFKSINGTPQSGKKQRRSSSFISTEVVSPGVSQGNQVAKSASPRRRTSSTPKNFTVSNVIEQITAQTPKSPVKRRSGESSSAKHDAAKEAGQVSPKKGGSTKRKSGELGSNLPNSKGKKKRVSFGGYLSPEFFDKRLPPDSPLRKGAAPRRSLSLLKPKQSLLRRASVIGLLKESEQGAGTTLQSKSPKTASPKTTPAKASAKAASPKTPKAASPKTPKAASPKTPKAASPKTPKAASPKTPKAASPKTPKAASPKTPKAASPKTPKAASPKTPRAASPAKPVADSDKSTPLAIKESKPVTPKRETSSGKRASLGPFPTSQDTSVLPQTPLGCEVQTPTVKGRFSVSCIGTPSPVTEVKAVSASVLSHPATPKIPLRRKSMKSTSKKTSNLSNSAVKVLQRSGVSRASMKISGRWADVVKFGKPKAQVVATKSKVPQKTQKTTNKLQVKTPARKLKGNASTGHADSPVTIVVGRAHKQAVATSSGAVPRVVTNIALFKRNMKMDEDLTGISEMFKTPVNERKGKSVIHEDKAPETPADHPTTVTDPSVLNTPEEPGEMMVSPLSVASTAKGRRYNSEAVQRLLNGDEKSGLNSVCPALNLSSDSSELMPSELQLNALTPRQNPETPECLTGVKRLMKTPRQKAEPVSDLRGKLLKTPKQKPEQPDCLSGVKRLMKTPKQKPEQPDCLSGVKRLMKTPKQKPEQPDCLSGVKRLMKTPKQKPEQPDCLSAVKRLMKTPVPKTPSPESRSDKLLKTPRQEAEHGEPLTAVMGTPQQTPVQPMKGLSVTKSFSGTPVTAEDQRLNSAEGSAEGQKTPEPRRSPQECLTGVRRLMRTPREKATPVEDMMGVKRLMQTPKEKGKAVEDNFGIKRLMKSPRLRGTAPVEDFEGLSELLEEPVPVYEQLETTQDEEVSPVEDEEVSPVEDVDVSHDRETEVSNEDNLKAEEHENVSHPVDIISPCASEEKTSADESSQGNVEEELELPVEPFVAEDPPMGAVVVEKATRGRRAKVPESTPTLDKQPEIPAPVRARRVRKAEATAPPVGRQMTRSRNLKSNNEEVELMVEENVFSSNVSPKLKRGRRAKKTSEDQTIEEVTTTAATAEKEPDLAESQQSQQGPIADVTAPSDEGLVKPKRGRKTTKPLISVTDQDEPQVDQIKAPTEEHEVILPSISETKTEKPHPNKKPVRGRRAKQVEPEGHSVEEAAETPALAAPVRGRRGRTLESAKPPAVRRNTRGRSAKSEESTADQPVKTQPAPETSPKASNASEDDKAPTEEAVIKPQRGRKPKHVNVEPEKSSLDLQASVKEIEQAETPMAEKPKRGRRARKDPAAPSEKAEDAVVPFAAVRGKRGRTAKPEEERTTVDNSEASLSEEPPKKTRRTKDLQQDMVETPAEETMEPAVAPKARRGRKLRQDPESPAVMKSDVQDVAVSITEKPKRGRKPKKSSEEVNEEQEPDAGETGDQVQETIEHKKTRGTRTSEKKEVKAREATTLPPETSADQPTKRGRRAATKPLTETETSEDANVAAKHANRSVKWKSDVQVFEIPKVTPVKAARGRRSKLDTESKCISNSTEEENLSERIAETQPAKRARRGAKAASAPHSEEKSKQDIEQEIQPKPRRGRTAKK